MPRPAKTLSVGNDNTQHLSMGVIALCFPASAVQKAIETLEGGRKPHMLAAGHFHKADWMPTYRNVAGVQTGCFQWQTPFMMTKGLAAHVGGWIIRVALQADKTLSTATRAEFVSFYSAGHGPC
jgi:hypothetical protein